MKSIFGETRDRMVRRYFPLSFRAGNRYDLLVDELVRVRATCIVEIGTCAGTTAARLIRAALAVSPHRLVRYWGFDLFEELSEARRRAEAAKQPAALATVQSRLDRLRYRGRSASVTLIAGDTCDTVPAWLERMPEIDLAFIDGGHSETTVRSDWEALSKKLATGGVIIFDDYPNWGVRPVVDSLDRRFWTIDLLDPADVFPDGSRCQLVRVRSRRNGESR